METLCPKCGKDDMSASVSGIYQSNTMTGSFSGPTTGVANNNGKLSPAIGYTTVSGTFQSDLAKLLQPPAKPGDGNFGCGSILLFGLCYVVGGISAIFLLLFIFNLFASILIVISTGGKGKEMFSPALGPILCGLPLSIALSIYGIKKLFNERKLWKSKAIAEFARWQKEFTIWQRLYYCQRDNMIFDPQTGRSCDVYSMQLLLKE